jgi:hypothetical protein
MTIQQRLDHGSISRCVGKNTKLPCLFLISSPTYQSVPSGDTWENTRYGYIAPLDWTQAMPSDGPENSEVALESLTFL